MYVVHTTKYWENGKNKAEILIERVKKTYARNFNYVKSVQQLVMG
jgi:hypothetical protein